MKKFVVLMVLLLGIGVSLLAAGCGGQSQKKVALIFSHEPARWTTGAQMMQEQLQQDGVQVTLSVFSTDEEQTQALQQAVDADVNCIVLAAAISGICRRDSRQPKRKISRLSTMMA
ncbi:MAG: hypothetical protein SOZ01_02045 [Selenomonadaceae bacterium]|nr:hypothetical protein [Selenomonadaceae bacterium]MDY3915514.1 hypothetical protein [Selenomonadaceae bacterium]